MRLRISVIVTSFNQISDLKRAVQSVLNQTLKPFELIICDDCSRDGSRSYINKLSKDVNFVKAVLHTKNVGVSANRNSGVAASQGDFVTFLDGDDCFYPTKIEHSAQRLSDLNKDIILYSNFDYGADKKVWRAKYSGASPFDFVKVFSRDTDNNKLFRNEIIPRWAFNEVGGFDESLSLYEDWDFRIRLSKICRLVHVAEIHSHYSENAGGLSKVNYNIHLKAILNIFKKNNHLIADKNQKRKIKSTLESFVYFLLCKVRVSNGTLSFEYLKALVRYYWYIWII